MTFKEFKRGMAQTLADEIKAQGLTRKEVARRMKVSPSFLTKALSGEQNLTLETFYKIGNAICPEGSK